MHENTPEATKGLRKYFVSNPRQGISFLGNYEFGSLLPCKGEKGSWPGGWMCSKLVTHPVHYFIGNRSCVCHSTPPPSGKIYNHYRFINITPLSAFVKAQIAVCI